MALADHDNLNSWKMAMLDKSLLMDKLINSIEYNWIEIKTGIVNHWDSDTFYRLGSDFANLLYKSIKDTE